MNCLCILYWLWFLSIIPSPAMSFSINPNKYNNNNKFKKQHLLDKPNINLNVNLNEISCSQNDLNTNITISKYTIQDKITGLSNLIRPVNILPTLFLTLFGGWVVHPSYTLFVSPNFVITMIITVIIMSTSMVLNDIYDVEIDKQNNPTRPLITGVITLQEAISLAGSLLCIAEYLNLCYLSSNLQWIVHVSIANIILYTPVFKRITFIKNVSCASLVALSIFFGALSTDTFIEIHYGFPILSISLSLVFLGSLYNEVLLDICDINGDKQHNIYTIPVVFGKKLSWIFASFILYSNIFLNSTALAYIYNGYIGSILAFICVPFIQDLYKIQQSNYSKETITDAVKKSTDIMLVLFIYLGLLSCIT